MTTPEEFRAFASKHPEFKDKDVESPFKTFEYFGFLKRVRPAIQNAAGRAIGQDERAAIGRSEAAEGVPGGVRGRW